MSGVYTCHRNFRFSGPCSGLQERAVPPDGNREVGPGLFGKADMPDSYGEPGTYAVGKIIEETVCHHHRVVAAHERAHQPFDFSQVGFLMSVAVYRDNHCSVLRVMETVIQERPERYISR